MAHELLSNVSYIKKIKIALVINFDTQEVPTWLNTLASLLRKGMADK